MSWQLTCDGMCYTVTSSEHFFSFKKNMYIFSFLQNMDYQFKNFCEMGPRSYLDIIMYFGGWHDQFHHSQTQLILADSSCILEAGMTSSTTLKHS